MDMPAIRESIEKTTRALTEHPEKARSKSAPLTARRVGGLRFEVKGGGGELVFTDMPAMMGGEGSAPNPGWLIRAALAAWGDAHSPVACALRIPPAISTEVEIVR